MKPHPALGLVLMTAIALPCGAAEAPDYSGADLYRIFCSSCHGAHAQGDGPAAASLKMPPADLTRIAARHGGQFPREDIRRIVDGRDSHAAHGSRDMPVWGWEFYGIDRDDAARRQRSEELIDRLVRYLQSVQR